MLDLRMKQVSEKRKHKKLLHLINVDVEKNLEVCRPFISREKTNIDSRKFLFYSENMGINH